jgi:small subunit ribosomal protein S1
VVEEQDKVEAVPTEITVDSQTLDATPAPPADTASVTPETPPAEAEAEALTAPPPEPVAPTEDEPAAEGEPAAEVEASGEAPKAKSDPTNKTRGKPARQTRVASLYRALRSERPMEGLVEQVIKGGYEVRLGKVRGFCPHSQIDVRRVDDPAEYVGKQYQFRVTQVRRGGEDVVVSRRAVLEDARREEASAVRATLLEGAVMRGHVASVAGFGAFVDLGAGVMGLVHVSELSHSRISRVEDVVKEGDEVSVKILKLHDSGKKISLSVRQAENDPWAGVGAQFQTGTAYPGVVRRLTQFGAFVELAPGVEALAPASEFPPSSKGWKESFAVGTSGDWLVLSVDASHRRISITPPVEGVDLAAALEQLKEGALIKGKVQRIEDYGVFVWLAPGRVGLMPNALTGTPRGSDMHRRFPLGQEIEVEIRELDDDARRIRLARKGVEAQPDRRPRSESRQRRSPSVDRPAPASDNSGFGTSLADKLRAALAESAERKS